MCMRHLVCVCYPHFDLKPGGYFPASVLDAGSMPDVPYDLAFWGPPCYSTPLWSEVGLPVS